MRGGTGRMGVAWLGNGLHHTAPPERRDRITRYSVRRPIEEAHCAVDVLLIEITPLQVALARPGIEGRAAV
jgi:hypothetical protein